MSRRVARALACVCLAAAFAGCKRAPQRAAAPAPAAPPPAAPPPPQASEPARAPAAAPAAEAVVTARRGQVELQRGAAGEWLVVQVGDRLGATDALRTELGEADLSVEGVQLRLHESSGVVLRKVASRSVHAQVRGRVESQVEAQKGQVDVEALGSDALAHSEGGHFFVNADGRGVVVVAAVDGSVHLSAAGKSVDVQRGEVSRVDATSNERGPGAPVAALRRVLLSVEWPAQETSSARLPIRGRVEPGSRVFVQGAQVPVDAGGEFRAEVPLREGKQKIAVYAIDALGRRKEVESVVARDDSLPDVQVKKKLWQWH